jgi:hypothetical protein
VDTTYHSLLLFRVYCFSLLYISHLLCIVQHDWFYMKDENNRNFHNILMSMCMNKLYNIITLKTKAKLEYCSALNLVLRISRIRLSSQKDLNLVVHMQHGPGGRTAIYFYNTFMWNLFTFIVLKLFPPFQFGIWQEDFLSRTWCKLLCLPRDRRSTKWILFRVVRCFTLLLQCDAVQIILNYFFL